MTRHDMRESTFVVVAGSAVASRVVQELAARGARLVLAGRDPGALAPALRSCARRRV